MIDTTRPQVVVLGTAQDGGAPQAGCTQTCCEWTRADPERRRLPASLGIIDPLAQKRWIIDCTPDFPEQLHRLNAVSDPSWGLAGVFLTHAHIGHYVGLIHLGKEVMGARGVPVYVMPRMRGFIESDSPWRQLVEQGNISLEPLADGLTIQLTSQVSVTPFEVPHRDEISETVGFKVHGPTRTVAHLPDIDSWAAWEQELGDFLSGLDVAWLDGTFFDSTELPHRDLSKISHPMMVTSLEALSPLPASLRDRVRFTHLNHSNPVINPESPQAAQIIASGAHLAAEGERFPL